MAEVNSKLTRTPQPTSLAVRPGLALSSAAKRPHAGFHPVLSHREENLEVVEKFPKWLDLLGRSKNTQQLYGRIVKEFVEFLRSERLAEITPATVRAFMAYQDSRNLSARTLDLTLPALKAIFNFLGIADIVEANPLRFMRRKPAARRLPDVPTVNEVSRIIAGAILPRDRAFLETLYASGCRQSEMIGMRVENLSFGNRSIKVRGKGDKERLVCLTPKAVGAIRAYLQGRSSGFLFRDDRRQEGYLTSAKGVWLGRWQTNYNRDEQGRLHWRSRTIRLGQTANMTVRKPSAGWRASCPKSYESRALAFLSHKGFAPNQLGRYGGVFEQRDDFLEGTIERWFRRPFPAI